MAIWGAIEIFKSMTNLLHKKIIPENADINITKPTQFPYVSFLVTQFLMEIGDKCQIGEITLLAKYGSKIVIIGGIIVV